MLRYALIQFDPATLRRFRDCWATPLGRGRLPGQAPAAIQAEAQTWKTRFQTLFVRAERFSKVVAQVRLFASRLDVLLFRRLEYEKGRGGPCRLRFDLGRSLRPLLLEGEVIQALRWMREQVSAQDEAAQRSLQDWESSLREWDATPGPLQAALAVYANNARQQAAAFKTAYQEWREEYVANVARLEQFVREMSRSVLEAWDRAGSRWSLGRLFGRRSPMVSLVLDLEHLELRQHVSPEQSLDRLRSIHLGPQAVVEASLALSELDGIHARLNEPG